MICEPHTSPTVKSGQIDLAIQALKNLNNNGVVILTSGFLSDVALPGGIGASIVNAGINGFVRCASTETKRGTRIVAISPGFVKESHYPEFIRKGLGEVSAKVLANAYLRAMLVGISGKVLTVTDSGMVES
jgi:NAD(P)-dependent dehydrogenase (short-subunit alcohol dehydrogenase family)